jgi:hypothetical protein
MLAQSTKALAPICKNPGCNNKATPDTRGRQREYCSKKCQLSAVKRGFVVIAPTKYIFDLKYCDKLLNEFIDWCENENEMKLVPIPGSGGKVASLRVQNSACIPTLAQYSRWLEKYKKIVIPDYTLEYWAANIPAFAQAYKKLKSIQKILLTNLGLAGRYNPNLTTLHLSLVGIQEPAKPQAVSFHNHYHLDAIKKIYEMADEEEKKLYGGKQ